MCVLINNLAKIVTCNELKFGENFHSKKSSYMKKLKLQFSFAFPFLQQFNRHVKQHANSDTNP